MSKNNVSKPRTKVAWQTVKMPTVLTPKQWSILQALPFVIMLHYLRAGHLHEILETILSSGGGKEVYHIARLADSHGIVVEKWQRNAGPRTKWRFLGWVNHLGTVKQFSNMYFTVAR